MAYEETREDIEKTLAEFRLERDHLNRLIEGYEKALRALEAPVPVRGGLIQPMTTSTRPATINVTPVGSW